MFALVRNYTPILLAVIAILAPACSSSPPTVEEQIAALGEIDFNFHVKPILSKNCYQCHGPDESTREADLRLDIPEGAYAVRDSAVAIEPGNPGKSLVTERITELNPEEIMPPPESHKSLSELEIGIINAWIEQGAVYKEHWAFIPPVRPDLPTTRMQRWPENEIDYFVLSMLERNGIKPSARATPNTLIRRLSFDLTGLPPTPEDVDAFVNDESENRYEQLVDRLMESPRFGERMALHWMDLARYADTNGYSIDGGRHMWLWRDWLIHSFNKNIPFDQFVIEQLAGDLLPDPTEAQMIATGFNRNHMITHEGGTIPEENLTNYVADRVRTTGEVFMGLTLGCAQCHDHKFDPISQKDYYQFFAFFNSIEDKGLDGDRGINSKPSMMAQSPLINAEEIEAIKERIAELERKKQTFADEQKDWETEQKQLLALRGKDLKTAPLIPLKITTPNRGNTGKILDDGSLLIDESGWLAGYNVSARLDTALIDAPVTGLRVEFYPNDVTDGYLGHSKIDSLRGTFLLTALSISKGALPSDQVDLYQILPFAQITASSAHPDYPTLDIYDERNHNGWSPHPNNKTPQHLTVTFESPLKATETPYITTMLVFGKGSHLIPGHFKLFAITGTDDGTNVPSEVQSYFTSNQENPTERQLKAVRAHFLKSSKATESLRIEMANLEERLDVLTEEHPTMVMQRAMAPRKTHILNRGQYDQPVAQVNANIPSIFPELAPQDTLTRLDLAQWLTSKDHPLLARVTVNRFWQMLFGTGIVSTPADFGSQGDLPTHPELLDWLAVEFINSGWDVKSLIKSMVMSATYRQSSIVPKDELQDDPGNTLLARGPRFRLQSEFIRDAALQVSGLLSDQIGGPSVRPYQPAGLWKEVSHYASTPATSQVFVQDKGDKLYKRSMYTYWKRTAPPPSMATFDAPNREVCTIKRESTNTPLQALVLLNDPQFVEANRHLAALLLEKETTDTERIQHAFKTILSRPADKSELKILTQRVTKERAYFEQNPQSADAFLRVGDSPIQSEFPPSELAAWTIVSSLIMNLSEAITRG